MSSKPGIIRRFFSGLGALLTFTRNAVLNLIFLFLLLFFLGALFSAPRIEVQQGSALVLDPSGVIVEQESFVDPLANLLGGPLSPATVGETRLRDVLDAIALARDDSRVSALVLRLGGLQDAGFSKLREIGEAIESFKASGKKVYAVGDSYTQSQYYLAAHADEVLLHPFGAVELEGFGAYQAYFSEALERLGINLHVFRVGEFKSAVEPFQRDGMSEQARADNLNWLNDLWGMYLTEVGAQRQVSPDAIEAGINDLGARLAAVGGDNAQFALQSGLVDRLGTRPELNEHLIAEIGADSAGRGFRQIDFRNYLRERANGPGSGAAGDSVAVIVGSGTILDGEQVPGNIGGDTLARLLDQAREAPRVKAVVLRLDTGGGSAFASEVIRNALLELREAGKPVVVSMGSVAASGGYWIAASADRIFASPATLTGSIGIFAIFPTFRDTLDRLGIRTDGVGTTELSGALVVGNDLPQEAVDAFQQTLEFGYRRFLDVVSEGRGMTLDEVDALAQGRVWSGRQAMEVGLVDNLGDLDEAVESAAALAGLDRYQVEYIERGLTPAEQLIRQLSQSLGLARLNLPFGAHIGSLLGRLEGDLENLVKLNDPRGLYLQCLECGMHLP